LAPDADRGIDGLLRVVLVIVALSRSHAVWSIDAWVWRRIGRPLPTEIPAWPRYLLFAQLVWVYFSGGHNKTGIEWGIPGGFTALANALTDPHFARFDPGWVAAVYPLTRVMTALTIVFELGAPVMLVLTYFAATADRPGRLRRWCNRLRLRWAWIALGVGFHLGIALTLRLGIFPAGMLVLYPVLLLPAELAALAAITARRRASCTRPPP
ncbi:MAG: HTTM domain-containing protein, partial [Deltaproteobacteria bacterium]|nr:HTTM domain-containing protein [Deltaproteobacteria bacterium]